MSDLLDIDLTDDQVGYAVFVARGDEFDLVARAWYTAALGHPPGIKDLHHMYWRCTVEKAHWKTMRTAMQTTWPRPDQPPVTVGTDPTPIAPGQPPIVIDIPPEIGGWPIGLDLGPLRVIPVTTAADGPFAKRMMSYWANAWVSGSHAFVFAGSLRTGGPLFFQVDLRTGQVVPLGRKIPYGGETEGWSWSPEGALYVLDGPRYRRLNVFTGEDQVLFDISAVYPGCTLTQPHSSPSGRTHSATVLRPTSDGPYERIATVVCRDGVLLPPFPAVGRLDESDIVGDDWVVIKETPVEAKDPGDNDNRVIHLVTRETRLIRDAQRALGHSACGPHYMVGEADKPDPGACGIWFLDQPLTPERFRLLFTTLNMGYVSVAAGKCLHSGETFLSLVDLQSGLVETLIAHGGGKAYDDRVKANLSPCGRVACYMVDGFVKLLVLP